MRLVCLVLVSLLELTLTRGQDQAGQGRVRRAGLHNNYVDDHCEGHFQLEANTIIRTEDSLAMGATFLNETQVSSLTRCLHRCCSYPLCNTAVFDERMESSEGGSCYLFDCGDPDRLKCQFTTNPDFSAAVLDIDRHKFELTAADQRQGHSSQLELLRGGAGAEQGAGPGRGRDCGQFEWRCSSGECIASYDTCTGIPQCADASDEDPALCPAPTTLAPPPHRHLRPDMDPPPQQQFPAQRPQQFWPQQQQQQQQQPGPDYFYPGGRGGGRGSADYVYQYPGRGPPQPYPAQYPVPQYPQPQLPYPGYPPQQQPAAPPRPQQPATRRPVEASTASSSSPRPSSTRRPPATTTTTTLSPEEKFEAQLISELGDELTSMEMPGLAVLTLTLGILISCLLCVLVVCRIRQGKMGFRRGLAHDADGDFLVNGMYL